MPPPQPPLTVIAEAFRNAVDAPPWYPQVAADLQAAADALT